MLVFDLLHPHLSSLTLRLIGAGAIVVMLGALAVVEFKEPPRRATWLVLSPVFIIGSITLIYVVLIAQGSIH